VVVAIAAVLVVLVMLAGILMAIETGLDPISMMISLSHSQLVKAFCSDILSDVPSTMRACVEELAGKII
jgi:hypothetical protein